MIEAYMVVWGCLMIATAIIIKYMAKHNPEVGFVKDFVIYGSLCTVTYWVSLSLSLFLFLGCTHVSADAIQVITNA